jgi:hypothetical protein
LPAEASAKAGGAQCGAISPRRENPDYAEPVIGRRFAPTRWLHPGYASADDVIE